MTILKKILWSLTIISFLLSVIYGILSFYYQPFHADYLINTALYFGVGLHIITLLTVMRYAPERNHIVMRALFFIVISLLFLVYSLKIAEDPRQLSHISIFMSIITIGIAGSFILNNLNIVKRFSYKTVLHGIYWTCISLIAGTFLFEIQSPFWIQIINYIILTLIVTYIATLIATPSSRIKDQ